MERLERHKRHACWPVAGVIALNCLVIGTNIAKLIEIAGADVWLIRTMPANDREWATWATTAAGNLGKVMGMIENEREIILELARLNVARFDWRTALAAREEIYSRAFIV